MGATKQWMLEEADKEFRKEEEEREKEEDRLALEEEAEEERKIEESIQSQIEEQYEEAEEERLIEESIQKQEEEKRVIVEGLTSAEAHTEIIVPLNVLFAPKEEEDAEVERLIEESIQKQEEEDRLIGAAEEEEDRLIEELNWHSSQMELLTRKLKELRPLLRIRLRHLAESLES